MKLLIAIPTLTAFYNYPTYFLLSIVGLLFILQVIGELMCSKPATGGSVPVSHYGQVKEVFDILPNKITCVSTDFTAWNYRDIQLLAIANDIRGNQGLTPVKTILDDITDDDLGLPELLTDQQKKNIHNICVERGKLLCHCIDVMAKEMDSKGMEVYESSAKSLGISLFIHISKFLP